MRVPSIAILGAGSWGTALALAAQRNGNRVVLWGHDAARMQAMAASRCNQRYLPDVALPDALEITADLKKAVTDVDIQLLAVPSHAFRDTLEQLKALCNHAIPIAWATKGWAPDSGDLLHRSVASIFSTDHPMAVLSGPTFAHEVAVGLPTAITLAANNPDFAERLSRLFHDTTFRVYTTNDLIGVQVGGALKNVLAIAAGISDGLGFGANARAALITRGLAEMMRLGLVLGGQHETFMGLAGMGDLVLTCTDNQSRNRRLGLALGKGQPLEQAMAAIAQEVEGVAAARNVHLLTKQHRIDMPIAIQVHQVLYDGLPPLQAVRNLLSREPKAERFR